MTYRTPSSADPSLLVAPAPPSVVPAEAGMHVPACRSAPPTANRAIR